MSSNFKYLSGFGSFWETEALPGALPQGQNSPKRAPYGLYAEQISGSAFTRPRHQNLRTWLYRIFPSVKQSDFEEVIHPGFLSADKPTKPRPNQFRWDPMPAPKKPTTFIDSWQALLYSGNPMGQTGATVYLYYANQSMQDTFFYNSDGELLIVPYKGQIIFKTEVGQLEVGPGEIICIPRGIKFTVEHQHDVAGYILENYSSPLTLPQLGPIGANGLANPRDFKTPHASYEDKSGSFRLLNKYANSLFVANLDHSPLNVVAWHGNYAPYKYDLRLFNTINTVSFDHPDPSIFTVLTSPSEAPGIANIDFVIFPERWMVAENTFRPPYYHRNIMSEYMGLIFGEYDAKADGFSPGGGSVHNCMSSHGPDADTFINASESDDAPVKQKDTLAFMFETSKPWIATQWAMDTPIRQRDYIDCWKNLPKQFNGR